MNKKKAAAIAGIVVLTLTGAGVFAIKANDKRAQIYEYKQTEADMITVELAMKDSEEITVEDVTEDIKAEDMTPAEKKDVTEAAEPDKQQLAEGVVKTDAPKPEVTTEKPKATAEAPKPATTEAPKPKATTEAPKPKATTEAPKPKATTEAPKPEVTTEAPKPENTTEATNPATTEATTEAKKEPKMVWHDPVYKTVTEEVPVYKEVEIMETVYCSICNKCGTILHTQDDIHNHFYGNYDCGSYRSYQYQRGTGEYKTVVWDYETVEKEVLVQEGYWEEVFE